MRLIYWLLHVSNCGSSSRQFYALKERLLRKHGTFTGHVIQEITKECWGDKRDEWGDLYECGPTCQRCGGTGIYSQRWIRLQKWKLGRYEFLVPDGDTHIKPERIDIVGYVRHRSYGILANECEMWLFLLCGEFREWWRLIARGGYFVKPKLWPMMRMQWLCGRTKHVLSQWKSQQRRKRIHATGEFDDAPF